MPVVLLRRTLTGWWECTIKFGKHRFFLMLSIVGLNESACLDKETRLNKKYMKREPVHIIPSQLLIS